MEKLLTMEVAIPLLIILFFSVTTILFYNKDIKNINKKDIDSK